MASPPSRQTAKVGGIGVASRNITGASWSDAVRNRLTTGLLEGAHNFQNAVAVPCAQIDLFRHQLGKFTHVNPAQTSADKCGSLVMSIQPGMVSRARFRLHGQYQIGALLAKLMDLRNWKSEMCD